MDPYQQTTVAPLLLAGHRATRITVLAAVARIDRCGW